MTKAKKAPDFSDIIDKCMFLKTAMMWCDENMDDSVDQLVKIAWIAEYTRFEYEEINKQMLFNLEAYLSYECVAAELISYQKIRTNIKTYTKDGLILLDKVCICIIFKTLNNILSTNYVLNINNMDYASRNLTKEQLQSYIEELDILFDEDSDKKISNLDKMKALYTVFQSPRMTNAVDGYAVTTHFVQKKNKDTNDLNEFIKKCDADFDKIINLYLDYLWKANKEKKDLQYVMAFKSWFEKNSDLWLEEIGENKESINLYTDTHQEIINIFNKLSEPIIRYVRKKSSPMG